jgi:hypothetical protein
MVCQIFWQQWKNTAMVQTHMPVAAVIALAQAVETRQSLDGISS